SAEGIPTAARARSPTSRDWRRQLCSFPRAAIKMTSNQEGLTLWSRLECSGTIMARCSLDLPGSIDPPASAWDYRHAATMSGSFLCFFVDRVSPCCPG
uniref:Uncharacterized protein n=1 Tax=Piliocolobus tephrosceles TaxID=591936 RepID=A0A8C9GD00_9PRIM